MTSIGPEMTDPSLTLPWPAATWATAGRPYQTPVTAAATATAAAAHTHTAPRCSVAYRRLQWFTPARVCAMTSSKAARSSALPTKSISEASTMSSGPSL